MGRYQDIKPLYYNGDLLTKEPTNKPAYYNFKDGHWSYTKCKYCVPMGVREDGIVTELPDKPAKWGDGEILI